MNLLQQQQRGLCHKGARVSPLSSRTVCPSRHAAAAAPRMARAEAALYDAAVKGDPSSNTLGDCT